MSGDHLNFTDLHTLKFIDVFWKWGDELTQRQSTMAIIEDTQRMKLAYPKLSSLVYTWRLESDPDDSYVITDPLLLYIAQILKYIVIN